MTQETRMACDDAAIKDTQHLAEMAKDLFEESPAYWGRGIHTIDYLEIPDLWTAEEAEDQEQWFGTKTFQATSGHYEVLSDAYGALDASGGEHTADPRTRRCGWAFVIFSRAKWRHSNCQQCRAPRPVPVAEVHERPFQSVH